MGCLVLAAIVGLVALVAHFGGGTPTKVAQPVTAPVVVERPHQSFSVASFRKDILNKCVDMVVWTDEPVEKAAVWAKDFKGFVVLQQPCAAAFGDRTVFASCTTSVPACTLHDGGRLLCASGNANEPYGGRPWDATARLYNVETLEAGDYKKDCVQNGGTWWAMAHDDPAYLHARGADKNSDVALHLVQKAVLTVDGRRSSMNVEDGIAFLIKAPTELKAGKGWSVSKGNSATYLVNYSFINGALGEARATWEADVSTKSVRYVNDNAKTFSWVPAE